MGRYPKLSAGGVTRDIDELTGIARNASKKGDAIA